MRLAPFAALLLLFLLAACPADPHTQRLAPLEASQRAELVRKLPPAEAQLLSAWLERQAHAKTALPAQITVAQAIEAQRAWMAQEQAAQARALSDAKRAEADKSARSTAFAQLASATVIDKRNETGDYDRKFIALDIAFENRSDKDILGIQGVIRISDIFGERITGIKWSFDKGIPAKKKFVQKGFGVEIDSFNQNDMKLWNKEFKKLKTSFEIRTILFKDGSKAEAPE